MRNPHLFSADPIIGDKGIWNTSAECDKQPESRFTKRQNHYDEED